MRRALLLMSIAVVAACSDAEEASSRSVGLGSGPPPATVERTCREWCSNEPQGPSCYQGPLESAERCYQGCLDSYQSELDSSGCGEQWIATMDCQLDEYCDDLFGDCDTDEVLFAECRSATRPSFEVALISPTGEPNRVELHLIEDCRNVRMGTRQVSSLANTVVIRHGPPAAFRHELSPGDYGLYGVAQDHDCAVVAAGCVPISITDTQETLALTLRGVEGTGCASRQFCSKETGECHEDNGDVGDAHDTSVGRGVGATSDYFRVTVNW
jgi:hypothetical protein